MIPGRVHVSILNWRSAPMSLRATDAALRAMDRVEGVVTLIDLYCAFLVSGILIWRFEPSRPLALLLIVATLGLGSLVPLLWLAFRGLGRLGATRRAG